MFVKIEKGSLHKPVLIVEYIREIVSLTPRGGVTSIYTGTGRAIFWGAFFRAGNKFWGIIFGKIIGGHKFWGIIFSITNYGPIIRYLFPT